MFMIKLASTFSRLVNYVQHVLTCQALYTYFIFYGNPKALPMLLPFIDKVKQDSNRLTLLSCTVESIASGQRADIQPV